VIGIVQVGPQALADRYTYIPLIGLFIALAWSVQDLIQRLRSERMAASAWAPKVPGAAAVLVLLACASATRAQLAHWKDTDAPFGQAVRVDPDNPIILNNIAFELIRAGRMREAV